MNSAHEEFKSKECNSLQSFGLKFPTMLKEVSEVTDKPPIAQTRAGKSEITVRPDEDMGDQDN